LQGLGLRAKWDRRSVFVVCRAVPSWFAGVRQTTKDDGLSHRPCYTPFMPEPRDVPDEPPPFLGSWKRVYIAVLLYLGAIIFGFYVFTRAYR